MNIRNLRSLAIAALGACALLLPSRLMSGPIVVRINDVPNAPPVITVIGAPNGYDIYTDDNIAVPGIEEGAVITLIGVNNPVQDPSIFPDDYLFDWSCRFVVPTAPNPERKAVDIVWVEHNFDDETSPLFGDLRVGFDSALLGTYYANPELRGEENLGVVTDKWVQVYANDTLVVLFKPHT